MFEEEKWDKEGQSTWRAEEKRVSTIEVINEEAFGYKPGIRFIIGLLIPIMFFLIPIPVEGQLLIPFAIVTGILVENYSLYAQGIGILFAAFSATMTLLATPFIQDRIPVNDGTVEKLNLADWEASILFGSTRIIGFVFLLVLAFGLGPDALHAPLVGELIWGDIIPLLIIVVPVGALLVNLLIDLGGLSFVGTLARPFMRPLFKLPGRSSLDALASVFGSNIVGYYVTYNVFSKGEYNKREAYILTTCFAPTNLGILALVAGFVDLIHLLPLIIIVWILTLLITAFILVRLPPLSRVPEQYISKPNPESSFTGSPDDYFQLAKAEALKKADGTTLSKAVYTGAVDGIKVSATVIGTIVAFSVPLLLVVETTGVFEAISSPIVPIIENLGIPDSETVSTAVFLGLANEGIPAIVAGGVGVNPMAGFFIVILSVTQIINFTATAPLMTDLFQDIPIRLRDLAFLWVMRTVILIPIVAVFTHLLSVFGLFG